MMINSMVIQKLLKSPARKGWEKVGIKHHHGIALPLSALHSDYSCGIGEFPDLFSLIDWCAEIGFDIIQLLPLNDSGTNPSPYNTLSAFALNPIFLGLSHLPNVKKSSLQSLQKLTKSQRIPYKKLYQLKEQFLREYFRREHPRPTINNLQSSIYNLNEYAQFKSLKNGNASEDEIAFHLFVQSLCAQQLKEVKAYANRKSILLKGDIPIFVSRNSCDVFHHHHLFLTQYSAGAPPDMYNAKGQVWGFPPYNWKEMEKENYHWWNMRLATAEQYYDLYRLDHVVGFFRTWTFPRKNAKKQGKFLPENEEMWLPQGQKIMQKLLEASSMLPIGEDLGVVPKEVKQCLQNLGICGTKVMRWERGWENNGEFLKPEKYPPESLTTVSTHDSETLTQWWQEQPEEAQVFAKLQGWQYQPTLSKEHRKAILWESHHSSSLFHINLLQEYLALIPEMTWPNPKDERINVPGTTYAKNWTYRFRPSVEKMVSNANLAHLMQRCII